MPNRSRKQLASDTPVQRVYWDACIFLELLAADSDLAKDVAAIWQQAVDGRVEIYTSELSIAEVVYSTQEQVGRALTNDEERKIDSLWHPMSPVKLLEISRPVLLKAREIKRMSHGKGIKIKEPDGIHLASAVVHKLAEFHSTDHFSKSADKRAELSALIGIKVCPPNAKGLLKF